MARKSIHRFQGIGSGLLPKDLNLRAQVALKGLSDAPVDDIVALLRSDEPIDTKTRVMLANALEGNTTGANFRVTNSDRTKFLRQLLRQIAHVRHGRWARRFIDRPRCAPAIDKLAKTMRKSAKAAEKCVTDSRKVDAWIAAARETFPEAAEFDDLELELAYAIAGIDKVRPETRLDETLKLISYVIRSILEFQDKALGADEWFVA